MLMNTKEIRRMRLVLTTRCCCRCTYCLVEKSNKTMSFQTAQRAIDFLLVSPGVFKELQIYGGEPLMEWDLLARVIIYATCKAQKLQKSVLISLATNALLLTEDQLVFFRRYGVRIYVSYSGNKIMHERYRVFPDATGTFANIQKQNKLLFSKYDPQHIVVLMCVHPATVSDMLRDFKTLLYQGARIVHVEPLVGVRWTPRDKRNFAMQMRRIFREVVVRLRRKEFIFIESLSACFIRRSVAVCLLHHTIEVYPNGNLSLRPYFSSHIREEGLIGNLKNGFSAQYSHCLYRMESARCQRCLSEYMRAAKPLSGGEIVRLRDRLSFEMFSKLCSAARDDGMIRAYAQKVMDGTRHRERTCVVHLDQCNQRCLFCFKGERLQQKVRISYKEVEQYLICAQQKGYTIVDFYGGEPTCFPFLKKTMALAHDLGMGITLATNGMAFSNKKYTALFSEIPIKGIRTTLHSNKPELHDHVTQVKGSFLRTTKGIRNLVACNQLVFVTIVVTSLNYTDLCAMVCLVHSYGAAGIKFSRLIDEGLACSNRRLYVDIKKVLPFLNQALAEAMKASFLQIEVENFPKEVISPDISHRLLFRTTTKDTMR